MADTKKKHNFRELIIWAGLVVLSALGYDTYLTPNAGEMTYESCEQEVEGLYKDAIQEVPQEVEPGGPSRPEIDKTRKEAKQKNLENTVLCNDLAAQQAMSDRADWGLFVGIWGLFFLWITVRQTREAARAASSTLEVARDATKAEFQPYIEVLNKIPVHTKPIPTKPTSENPIMWGVYINGFEIKNIGKTPASAVKVKVRGKFEKDGRTFKKRGIVSGLKKGDFFSGKTWPCESEVKFESPEGTTDYFADITEMDIYISVIFTDMFSDEKKRKYVFHYLYNKSLEGATLQSVTEKTPKRGLRS